MEIKLPKENMTKEELFDFLYQLCVALNFNIQDLNRKIDEVKRNEQS